MDAILIVILFAVLLTVALIVYAVRLKASRERDAERMRSERTRYESESAARGEFAAQQRRLVTASVRYEVLRRDNFRCVICGASAKNGAVLHVDHILPVSKGGTSEMANLRTLCDRCNLGKGSKIE